MRKASWIHLLTGLVAATMVFTLATDEAHADRRSSFAGNLLITDQDDVYIYPQLTLEHRNLVSFDFYPGNTLTGVLGAGVQPPDSNNGGFNNGNNGGTNNPVNNGTANNGTANNGTANNGTNNGTTTDGSTGQLGSYDEATPAIPGGPNSMGGGGLLLFGQENFAFGVSSHRQDLYGATAAQFLGVGDLQLYGAGANRAWGYLGHNSPAPGSVFLPSAPGGAQVAGGGGGLLVQPLQLADLLFGFGVGEHMAGARISIGQASYSQRRLGQTVEDEDGWNTTVLDLTAGFSLRGLGFDLDLNLELGLAFLNNTYVTNQNTPNYNDTATLAPSFSLSGRSFIPLRESIKLGVLGVIHVNSASFEDEFGVSSGSSTTPNATSFSSSNFFLETGAGPVYELPDSTTIAGYGTLGFGTTSYADEGQSFSTSALMLPGFKLALEHYILNWLVFRSGLSSRYYFAFQSQEYEDENIPNVSSSSTYYEFLWSAGLGFEVGNFELNGTFTSPFVTSGPAILSGQQTGLWALLNATYKF